MNHGMNRSREHVPHYSKIHLAYSRRGQDGKKNYWCPLLAVEISSRSRNLVGVGVVLSRELRVELDVGNALAVQLVLVVFRLHRGRLPRSDTRDWHTEGAARHVLKVHVVEERHRAWLSTVLSADAHLHYIFNIGVFNSN